MKLFSKKEIANNATTARIALWYTLSNFFVHGLAVISAPIFSRLLTKAEYGAFSNFTSWESIMLVLCTLDFSISITRAKYDFDKDMDQYLSSILLFSNIVTVIVYAVVEINKDFFADYMSMDIMYIRIMFVYILFYPAFSYLQIKHRIYRRYIFFIIFSAFTALLRTLLSVLLVLLLEDKLKGRIIGYIFPITILNFVLWLYIVIKGKKIARKCIVFACTISIPLIPHTLSGILLASVDRIMITNICGDEATALYSLPYQVSSIANLIWMSMNQAWAPWLYDNINGKKFEAIRKNSKIYLGTFSILVIGLLLISPEIVLILGGLSYYEARFVIPPVILATAFQFIYGMFVNLEIYAKKTISISVGTMGASLINWGLNYLFIPQFGYLAAAYTTLVGYIALFLFHYLIVKCKISSLSKIYSDKFIVFIILILSLVSFSSLVLYKMNFLRYVLLILYIVVVLLCCYIKRQEIKKILGMN